MKVYLIFLLSLLGLSFADGHQSTHDAPAALVHVSEGVLGSYLSDAQGMTLYIFTQDTQGENSSTCSGGCAGAWPPFLLEANEESHDARTEAFEIEGVTGTFTTFSREDGSIQLAYDGMPLYYWAGDQKAGDTLGHGMGNVWFVAALVALEEGN